MAKTVESDSSFPSRGSPDTDASVKLIPSSRNWKASSKLCSVLLNKCQSLEIAKWHFVGYPSCRIITTLSINSGILSQYSHLMSHITDLLRQRWSLSYLPQTSESRKINRVIRINVNPFQTGKGMEVSWLPHLYKH